MGKCAEFFHGTTELGNYRAGEGQSWLGVSVFVGGPEPVCGTTGLSAPAFTRTRAWGAAFGDPRVGPGWSWCETGRLFAGTAAVYLVSA